MADPKSSIKLKQRALANVIIFGRSVTFVLQNLKTVVGPNTFDKWYNPLMEEMKKDALLKAFKDARNNLEKQGKLTTSTTGRLKFTGKDLKEWQKNRPANAKSFFIGDSFGGSGWEILMPDGTTEKLYLDIDFGEKVKFTVFFLKPPITHKDKLIEDTSIENCCLLYYNYLNGLVRKAMIEFHS